MKPLFRAWGRLLAIASRRRAELDMADEIACHLQMQTDNNLRLGMRPAEAEREARLKFGALEAVKESCRDQQGLPWIETLLTDVRYALRCLRRSAGFTVTAVSALALGIGSTTAVFSVVNAVLLKPMPVRDPDRFVVPVNTMVAPNGQTAFGAMASPAKFAFWRAQSSVLQDVSAYSLGQMNYTGGEVAEQLRSMRASADFLSGLGSPILRGRVFTPEQDVPNGPRVALIGASFWERRFGSDPQILGRSISLDGEPYTVIGIVAHDPAKLEFGPLPDVIVPFQLDPDSADQGHYFATVARLKPGVSLEQARARLQASAAEYRAKFPAGLGPKEGFSVVRFREAAIGGTGPLLWVLLGAVGLVLLIACANVANLLLVRATGRRREFAIRAAIGSGRGRILRQLLTESLLLSLTGGALGLLLGYAGIRALLAVNTAGLPRVGANGDAVAMDWRVMGFALALSLLTGIVFGLFPAITGSRADLNTILKDSNGRLGTGLRQIKIRATLVVSEVSLAVVLLVGSALLIRTFVALYAVDRGFDSRNMVTMRMSLTGPKYLKSAGVADTVREGLERIRALPGVVAATAACCVPLENGFALPFNVAGRRSPGVGGTAGWADIAPGYFEVFKIPVKRGRTFTDRDTVAAPPVALINEAMAKQYWPDSDPLQDRILLGRGMMKQLKNEPARQIIGIVGNVRDGGLGVDPRPSVYVPQAQIPDALNALSMGTTPIAWVVRTRTDPRRLGPVIRDQLRIVTGLPAADVHSMEQTVSLSTGRRRFNMLLMTVFGSVALLLAAIGIYGLMAYSVEQRTQDFGIRLALGAQASQVRNMVVRQGMALTLVGVVAGLGAAWALARLIESLLFGVKGRDPMVFICVPIVLAAVALFAIWFPANRASRVSPIESLRYE
jgi:putative ABC transport system permease protein